MIKRINDYQYLHYVFITRGTKEEIADFFKKYPLFRGKVNVIMYTYDIEKLVKPQAIPFCFMVDDKDVVIY